MALHFNQGGFVLLPAPPAPTICLDAVGITVIDLDAVWFVCND